MDNIIYQVLLGLASGGIYAALALALVMIYQSTHHINFAQGEMAMFSTFVAWSLLQTGVLPYWAVFLIVVIGSFAIGMAMQWFIVRPLARAPALTNVILFVALLLIFNSMAGWIFGYTIRDFPSPFRSDGILKLGPLSAHQIGAALVTLAMLGLIFAFFRFTNFGLAMRAAALNPVSSRFVGLRVGRMLAVGWGLAAAIGAVAGMMVAPIIFLDPNMMMGVLLYGFAGALLGGINNPWGAVAGGFLVGILENLAGTYLVGTELKLTVALAAIVVVLILRPQGLFGRQIHQRV